MEKKSKNRLKIAIIIILSFLLGGIVGFSFMPAMRAMVGRNHDKAIAYCQENSKRGATEFELIGGGSGHDGYFHFIALDGDDEKGQEMFIFKMKRSPFGDNKLTFFAHAFDEGKPVGTLQATLRDDNGKKDAGDTLYFFGANKENEPAIDLMIYKYVGVDEDGETVMEYEEDRPWPERHFIYWSNYNDLSSRKELQDRGFFLIGTDESGVKWSVKDVKFMDKDGNVVFEYN